MDKIKYLLWPIAAILLVIGAAAQPYTYVKGKREPLKVYLSRKGVLSDMTAPAPQLLSSSAKVRKVLDFDPLRLTIYDVDPNTCAANLIPESKESEYSVYDCYITDSGDIAVPTGYIDVTLKNPGDTLLLRQACKDYKCIIERASALFPEIYMIRIVPGEGRDPVKIANSIYETGNFTRATAAMWMENMLHISYDPLTTKQWGLYNYDHPGKDIDVSRAWNYATGRNVNIGIIDNGMDISLDDLRPRVLESYDADTQKTPCSPDSLHGTMCAGIAVATRNNNKNIAGVAPDAMIIPVTVNIPKLKSPLVLAEAIKWCCEKGADVLSCSWGCEYDENIEKALKEAATKGRNGKGCVIVSSAGNLANDSTSISFPATLPYVIAVGNMQSNGVINERSRSGPNMCVVAPGTDIVTLAPGKEYVLATGTSFAAPHVSGIAALILQRNPDLTSQQVRDIIVKSAVKIGPLDPENPDSWDKHYGYGLVNAYQAVINTPRLQK